MKVCVTGASTVSCSQPGTTTSDTGISVGISYTHRHNDEEDERSPETLPLSSSCSVLLLIRASIVSVKGDPDGILGLHSLNAYVAADRWRGIPTRLSGPQLQNLYESLFNVLR